MMINLTSDYVKKDKYEKLNFNIFIYSFFII